MINFFCIHHSPAKDRKDYLLPFFDKDNLSVNWIESFLPSCEEIVNLKKIYNYHAANKSYLSNSEISCYLKHLKAIENIANSGFSGLIIEDDIEIPNFSLNEYCIKIEKELLDNDGDILFIGSFSNNDIAFDSPNEIVHEKWMRSRCAHCYLITNKTANKILDYMSNIIAPLDWQLNYAIEEFNLKCFWSKTHINQRTEKGIIPSLLR